MAAPQKPSKLGWPAYQPPTPRFTVCPVCKAVCLNQWQDGQLLTAALGLPHVCLIAPITNEGQ